MTVQAPPLRTAARALVVAIVAAVLPLSLAAPASAARVKTITIADASIVEGNAGQQNLAFTLKWTGSKGGGAPSVQWATAAGTATAGTDYATSSGTANLTNGGCRCATVNVPVKGDTTTEGTETFVVNLSGATNGTIGDAQATGTIYDNEGPPAIVVGDVAAAEADGAMGFTVQLTNASASTITVDYATSDGTATAGADYTAAGATLTFTPGQTSKSISVTVTDESLAEDDETIALDLSNPTNASIVDAQGLGSITNDDADPTVSIADTSVGEADGTATLTVSLSAASGRETAVDYATSDATAAAGADYTAASGTLTIPAGTTSAQVDVSVAADDTHEGDETLTVTLSGEVNLTLGTATATATIVDDDAVPTVSASDESASESAGTATVTISLSRATVDEVSVDWATADGTATAGADYTAASGSATIPAGATSTTVDVALLGDTVDEPSETLVVSLSNATGATLGSGATVTLTDDDATPTSLTAKVAKTKTSVKVKGLLEQASSGLSVKVTIFKKKGTKYVRVSAKTVAVKSVKDRDGDTQAEGAYLAAFAKPAKGSYKAKVVFKATGDYKGSAKTVTFRI